MERLERTQEVVGKGRRRDDPLAGGGVIELDRARVEREAM
jgi:hypothetical protein